MLFVPADPGGLALDRAVTYRGDQILVGRTDLGAGALVATVRTSEVREWARAGGGEWPPELGIFPQLRVVYLWDGETFHFAGIAPDTQRALLYSKGELIEGATAPDRCGDRVAPGHSQGEKLYDALWRGTYVPRLFDVPGMAQGARAREVHKPFRRGLADR
jgi:hypothetical protein